MIGSGAEWEAAAEEVGRLLAERGCTVVTGGLGEVMAAAHRGAKAAGGTTIAILPGESAAANRWADHVVVTGIGHARNLAVAASGDAVIAVGGSYGTLAEMAFALRLGRPCRRARGRSRGRGRAARGDARRGGRARATRPRLGGARGSGARPRSWSARAPAGTRRRPRRAGRGGGRGRRGRRGAGGSRRAPRSRR